MPDEKMYSYKALEYSSSSVIGASLGLQCLFVAADSLLDEKQYVAEAEDSFAAMATFAIIAPRRFQVIVPSRFYVESPH